MTLLEDIEEEAEQRRVEDENARRLQWLIQQERKRREDEDEDERKRQNIEEINKQIRDQAGGKDRKPAQEGAGKTPAGETTTRAGAAARTGAAASGAGAAAGGAAAGGAAAGGAAAGGAAAGGAAAGGAAATAATAGAAATFPVWGIVLLVVLGIILVVIIIFSTFYTICNPTTVKGRVAGKIAEWTILPDGICDALDSFGGGGAISSVTNAMCASPQNLAAQNNTPYPAKNDPELDRLIACVSGRVALGNTPIYTFDLSHATCNYTRGQPLCEACSHSQNSCHYGGAGGSTGSLAADFAVVGAQGSAVLQAAAQCGIPLKRATCEDKQGNAVLCSVSGATHVHLSLGKCGSDNGPINTR